MYIYFRKNNCLHTTARFLGNISAASPNRAATFLGRNQKTKSAIGDFFLVNYVQKRIFEQSDGTCRFKKKNKHVCYLKENVH